MSVPTHSHLVDTKGSAFGVDQIANKIRTSSMPYAWDISKGNVANHAPLNKFGHQSSIGTTLQEIWDYDDTYTYMTTASTLYLSSDDNTDDQPYEIQGLDAMWNLQIVTVICQGFTFVELPGSWIRVFRVKNVGTTDNAGNIYVSDDNTDAGGDGIPDTTSAIKAMVTAGYNQTLMALWSVPDGATVAYLTSFYASTTAVRGTQINLFVRPFGGVFQIKKILSLYTGSERIIYDFPLKIPAKSDIAIKAVGVGAGTSAVSAGFDLWYEE